MRKTWTEQMISVALSEIIASIGRMPTNSELREMNRTDLASQISRRGGFSGWAARLGATLSQGDSQTGWDGEIALANKLEARGFEVERLAPVKSPYDLRLNKCLRLDVKSANFAEYGACRGWFYRIGKEAQADVLALFQLDTEACYFIPWSICPATNVTISRGGGKWEYFKDRYDILESIIKHREIEARYWPGMAERTIFNPQ
jgi:hypothetical protein